MKYIKWFLLETIGIAATLGVVILSPVIALFIDSNGQLPNGLKWASTYDNPAIGDEAFHKNQMSWTTSKYLYCIFWLIRNPACGYDAIAGYTLQDGFIYSSFGTENIGVTYNDKTNTATLVEGSISRKMVNGDGKEYFQIGKVWRWNSTRACRVSLGWACQPEHFVGRRYTLNFSINPWMSA